MADCSKCGRTADAIVHTDLGDFPACEKHILAVAPRAKDVRVEYTPEFIRERDRPRCTMCREEYYGNFAVTTQDGVTVNVCDEHLRHAIPEFDCATVCRSKEWQEDRRAEIAAWEERKASWR